jgi:hypothetical protein
MARSSRLAEGEMPTSRNDQRQTRNLRNVQNRRDAFVAGE